MKNNYLRQTIVFLLAMSVLSFTTKGKHIEKICGPSFYADNTGYSNSSAPEINSITISDGVSYSETFYPSNGGDRVHLVQIGGITTITVVVENDWSGYSAKIGIRQGSTVIQCQSYNYSQGTYTFTFIANSWNCGSYDIFTDINPC